MKLNLKYNNQNHQLQVDRTKPISRLRKTIRDLLDLDEKRIVLFYHGKILENKNTLYDYNVKDNSAILLHYRAEQTEQPKVKTEENNLTPTSESNELTKESDATADSEAEAKALAELGVDVDAIPQEDCTLCDNKETSDCSYCGCNICQKKSDPDKQLICEECQMYFHIYCLPSPVEKIPEEEWYCHGCYNDPDLIIGAGKSVKSRTNASKRSWDNGMACAGVQKKCTIVPSTHIGKIPGVPVGSWWEFRVQVAESGVHRPPVSGISGTSKNGSVSIVLAGGYEDDDDFGNEFYYTGSGGRDLSGNKRTAGQSSDQTLTKSNFTLALNCDAPIDTENGATARDWKKSKPVRVVRNYKLNKHHPEYAPETGNRYDGLYKLVKYWPDKGKEGFIVWRYHYRRDDDEPAPWTEEGKQRIKELGLEPIPSVNSNTIKSKGTKQDKKDKEDSSSSNITLKKKFRVKIPRLETINSITPFLTPKLTMTNSQDVKYEVSPESRDLIAQDSENSRIWDDIIEYPGKNITEFLEKVAREFNCPICFDLVDKPITTNCTHNACSSCLKNSIRYYSNKCPTCRAVLFDEVANLSKTKQINALIKIIEEHAVNTKLDKVLTHLFPTMRQK